MKRTRIYRKDRERVKDNHRRFLYRNHAINGRYEINVDTEDTSVSESETNKWSPEWLKRCRVTVVPQKLDKGIGHWSEYPKTKYHGSKGYYRKKGWKCKAFKEMLLSELTEKEKNNEAQVSD